MLAFQLDNVSNPIVNFYADNFSESQYWQPAWLEAISYGVQPDLSDLHTVLWQDGTLDSDVNVLCEFIDVDGKHGFGKIQRWATNPYDLYDNDTSEDYAYVLTEEGGATYAHEANIIPICEVDTYDHEQLALQDVPDPVADSGQADNVFYYPVLFPLQASAFITSLPVAGGAA